MKEPLWGQRPVTEVKRAFHKVIISPPVSNIVSPLRRTDIETQRSEQTSPSSSSIKSSTQENSVLESKSDTSCNEYEDALDDCHNANYNSASDRILNTSSSSSFEDQTSLPSQTL